MRAHPRPALVAVAATHSGTLHALPAPNACYFALPFPAREDAQALCLIAVKKGRGGRAGGFGGLSRPSGGEEWRAGEGTAHGHLSRDWDCCTHLAFVSTSRLSGQASSTHRSLFFPHGSSPISRPPALVCPVREPGCSSPSYYGHIPFFLLSQTLQHKQPFRSRITADYQQPTTATQTPNSNERTRRGPA